MEISFIEMFCGIGGFRLGLEKTNNRRFLQGTKNKSVRGDISLTTEGQTRFKGFRCLWANDNDKYACKIYRKNFGDKELVEADIKTVEVDSIPDHTLLTTGFPCQAFSVAGKRKGFSDTRGTLFYDIARVAKAKKPKLLLLENVKGLLSHDKGLTFQIIIESLEELGYLVEWQVLNSKYFGVPQNRERVFIVGHLRGASTQQIFPIGKDNSRDSQDCESGKIRYAHKADRELSRIYEVEGLAPTLHGKTGGWQEPKIVTVMEGQKYERKPKDGKIQGGSSSSITKRVYGKEGLSPGLMTQKRVVPKIVADRTRSYAGKGRNLESPKEITNALSGVQKDNLLMFLSDNKGGNIKKRVRSLDNPTWCLGGSETKILEVGNIYESGGEAGKVHDSRGIFSTVKQGKRGGKAGVPPILHNARIRRLTPTECERLQGFPDGWTDGVSDTQRYKLLGNAVTVNVIEFLGKLCRGLWRAV